jgi:formylmethanofuran dehydrogenase subunit E
MNDQPDRRYRLRGRAPSGGRSRVAASAVAAIVLAAGACAHAQSTAEEWVALGARVHGGFGTYIALGIRIGEDAVRVLGAKPRELDVTLFDGAATPCPCVIDGVMIATYASPGQGTLRVAAEKAPPESMGVVVIRHRKTGEGLRYAIPDALRPKLAEWNKANDRVGRYRVVMAEPEANVFMREPAH